MALSPGLMVCFVQQVRNQIERKPDGFTQIWKWRSVPPGQTSNGLGEGEHGPREMSKVEMALRE